MTGSKTAPLPAHAEHVRVVAGERLADELLRLHPDVVVDAMGLLCPLPIARLGEAARRAAPNTLILLINDDPAVVLDVIAWCKSTRNELLGILKDDRNAFFCYIRKTAAGVEKPHQET